MKKTLIAIASLAVFFAAGAYYIKADVYGSSLKGWWSMDSNSITETLEQTTTGTGTGDQTITVPSGLSNVTIVYCSVINDGDHAHTDIDGSFTFGGTTMTSAFSQVNQGNYHVQCYYLTSYSGSGSQTMHYGNHGGFGTMQWAVYIISGSDAAQPDITGTNNNSGSANPSTSFTTASANDLAFEAIGGSNSLTAASGQTVDQSSDTNLAVAHKTISAGGAASLAWTMSSGSWAQGVVVIKPSASGTTLADNSGNGNTAKIAGAPTPIAGKLAQALNFNGSSSYVYISSPTGLSFSGDFTVSLWARPTAVGTYQILIDQGQDVCFGTYYTVALNNNFSNAFVFTTKGSTNNIQTPSATHAVNGTWYDVTMVRSSSTPLVYINGALETTGSTIADDLTNSKSLTIGADSCNSGFFADYFSGSIDDVRIYNRALTAAEVQTLYYQGVSQHANGSY